MMVRKNIFKIFVVAVFALSLFASCSKKSMKTPNPEITPPIDTGPNLGGGGTVNCPDSSAVSFGGGATARLYIPDLDSNCRSAVFESYTGTRVNLSNVLINLDVFNVANQGQPAQYGGTFKIGRSEYNRPIIASFSSGTSVYDTRYNKWYTNGGKQRLKLFFQDSLGGVIVIIEQVAYNDLGYTYRGDVYFRNFDFGVCAQPPPYAPAQCGQQSPQKCWNISLGPYDCRAFMSGNDVRPDIITLPGFGSHPSGYNGPGYQKLGSFEDLNIYSGLNSNL